MAPLFAALAQERPGADELMDWLGRYVANARGAAGGAAPAVGTASAVAAPSVVEVLNDVMQKSENIRPSITGAADSTADAKPAAGATPAAGELVGCGPALKPGEEPVEMDTAASEVGVAGNAIGSEQNAPTGDQRPG